MTDTRAPLDLTKFDSLIEWATSVGHKRELVEISELPDLLAEVVRLWDALERMLCEDCPPVGYPTDETRCRGCPRRSALTGEEG